MNRRRILTGWRAAAAGAAAGYVLGAVSFSKLLGERFAPGEDISVSHMEVPETGAMIEFRGITPTSVREHAGTPAMVAAIALEAAKALVPTLAARRLLPGTPAAPAAAAGSVLGHAVPVWTGGKGGYGASPMLGGLLVLDPLGFLVTNAAVSAAIAVTRDRRLIMIWPLTVPIWAAVRRRWDVLGFGLVANAIMWTRLVPELRSSMRGLLVQEKGTPDVP